MEEEGGGERGRGVFRREGGGCGARTHQPSPQHTGSEAGEVVSESLEERANTEQ